MSVSALQTNVKTALAELKTKCNQQGRTDLDHEIKKLAKTVQLRQQARDALFSDHETKQESTSNELDVFKMGNVTKKELTENLNCEDRSSDLFIETVSALKSFAEDQFSIDTPSIVRCRYKQYANAIVRKLFDSSPRDTLKRALKPFDRHNEQSDSKLHSAVHEWTGSDDLADKVEALSRKIVKL
jgi:hypothetical protein